MHFFSSAAPASGSWGYYKTFESGLAKKTWQLPTSRSWGTPATVAYRISTSAFVPLLLVADFFIALLKLTIGNGFIFLHNIFSKTSHSIAKAVKGDKPKNSFLETVKKITQYKYFLYGAVATTAICGYLFFAKFAKADEGILKFYLNYAKGIGNCWWGAYKITSGVVSLGYHSIELIGNIAYAILEAPWISSTKEPSSILGTISSTWENIGNIFSPFIDTFSSAGGCIGNISDGFKALVIDPAISFYERI